jgi:hypothetical protein
VILPQQELGASCFITSISGSSSGMCESVFPVYSFTPFTTSYTLSYQILTRLDSHYITRQESGVLCGSIKFLMNIALGAVLLSNAICLNDFDGNGLIGFVVLMGFTFMSILILLAANYNDL